MVGHVIAHYRVTARLGQGGMGAVYQATDTKLDREVAIKVLPDSFIHDPQRLTRFEREAKALAALNHPNIASIHGLEQSGESQALILELIEGEDLSERLKRGPLTVEETLEVCKQVAEALEAAHEKGIIHRDLKPGNIKLLPDGRVKVLDFGLAKVISDAPSTTQGSTALTDSPTVFTQGQATMPGVLLGTAGYMSPEQARGKQVDKRSDIWSFGVVVFECLTGARLFTGETVTDSVGALLHKEIDWGQLPPTTPPAVQLLLRKCLARDRRRRLPDIGSARLDLEEAIADPRKSFMQLGKGALQEANAGRGMLSVGTTGIVTVVAILSMTAGWFLKPKPPSPAPRQIKQLLHSAEGMEAWYAAFAISPDGEQLVYQLPGAPSSLRLLSLTTGQDEEIPGTQGGANPFIRPDGRSMGFESDEGLRIIDLQTKQSTVLVPGVSGMRGASWGPSQIVYTRNGGGNGLWLMGRERPITETSKGEGNGRNVHRWPQWLPGGRHVLFMSGDSHDPESLNAEVVDVETMMRTTVLTNCIYARYAKSGHLLFVKDGSLFASAFDLEALEVRGERQVLRSGVAVTSGEMAQYTLSEEGTLVYLNGPDNSGENRRKLLWLELPSGNETPASMVTDGLWGVALSSDGRMVASAKEDRICSLDLADPSAAPTPITPAGETHAHPLWVPNTTSRSFVYRSQRDGREGIWLKNGPFDQPRLLFPEVDTTVYPYSFSTDGKLLFGSTFDRDRRESSIWVHAIGDTNEAQRILRGNAVLAGPALSPDGEWLVYSKGFDLFLRPYGKAGAGEQQLTTDGGMNPRWSRNADRIYYSSWDSFWVLDLHLLGEVPERSQPRKLFDWPQNRPQGFANFWDIDPEEKRVLVMVNDTDVSLGTPESSGDSAVNIVFNFFTELEEKVPTGND